MHICNHKEAKKKAQKLLLLLRNEKKYRFRYVNKL